MKKKKTRLKDLNMTSVDLVKRGANQKADIMLYKSADEPEDEIPQGLWKSIQDAVSAWWNGQDEVKKAFDADKSSYFDALDYSINTIIQDDTMDDVAKKEMAIESIGQFAEAMTERIAKALDVEYETQIDAYSDFDGEDEQTLDGIAKSQTEDTTEGLGQAEYEEEGEQTMKIDKSRFTADELVQYQSLIAKGMVDEDEEDEYVPEEPTTRKRRVIEDEDEVHPAVAKALQQVENMQKSMEMKEMVEVAKKYAPLGEREDELAETLYDMKKSNQRTYDSYIALLDRQMDMVNKSGLFTEIGKSGRGYVASGDTVDKIESIATEIMKSEPTLNRYEAINKAWEQNPELLAEYERAYQGGNR